MHISTRRRLSRVAVTAVALAAATALVVPTPATAVAPTASSTAGLYGSGDPTYDGVYRQSLAILGLKAAKAPVPAAAIAWLTGQQCTDGSYQAYRADLNQPCIAPDTANFAGPDSNSTAIAALALRAVGRTNAANRAADALRAKQNADGGWGFILGGASDVNSTGLALSALQGFATTLQANGPIPRGTAYLKSTQVACTAPVATRGALPYQPGQAANAFASVQGLGGWAGTLPVAAPARVAALSGVGCGSPALVRLASYVNRLIVSTKGRIPSLMDSTAIDWNSTALGVLGLASAKAGASGMAVGITALGRNTAAYTGTGASVFPGAVGTLIQAAVATGRNPRAFGTGKTNLVRLLNSTLQR